MARSTNWSVPKLWDGGTVAILGSGPSMSAVVAESIRHAGVNSIVINNTFRLAPWADMLYAADALWWQTYYKNTQEFFGLKVSCSQVSFCDVLIVRNSGVEGFDPDPTAVRTGGNSGYQAIHIAAHAGAKRILLFGFDMHGTHWHGRHASPLRDHGEAIYPRWIKRFSTLAPELARRGIEVINCTPRSALKIWPHKNLEEVMKSCAAQFA